MSEEAIEEEVTMTDQEIHAELKELGVKVHHKTGSDKLRETLAAVKAGTYEAPVAKAKTPEAPAAPVVPVGPSLLAQKAAADSQRLTKTQKAMALVRIIVVPNDPHLASHTGMIFTVGSSSVNNGRMVKKFVPFNNEEGWHVPQIIVTQIQNAQMQKFRTVKMPNGEKAPQAYIAKKFNVQILDPLNQEEMDTLAAAQSSRGDA